MVRFRHRLRVLEALVLVLLARVLRTRVPMRRWAPLLGQRGAASTELVTGPLPAVEASVAAAVAGARRRSAANCLEEAVAGSLMLRWRGVRSVVVIGLDSAGSGRPPHAWLVGSSGRVLTGGSAVPGYRPASQFGRLR